MQSFWDNPPSRNNRIGCCGETASSENWSLWCTALRCNTQSIKRKEKNAAWAFVWRLAFVPPFSGIYIYLYGFIVIETATGHWVQVERLWLSLSLYNYIYCTWRLFGGWCDFRDTLWPCSDVTFTDLMWLSRADMLGPAAKWSWWVLERSLQHGHPLVEGNVWKCCDRIKGHVQPIRVISGN